VRAARNAAQAPRWRGEDRRETFVTRKITREVVSGVCAALIEKAWHKCGVVAEGAEDPVAPGRRLVRVDHRYYLPSGLWADWEMHPRPDSAWTGSRRSVLTS
jgi:hypothetical protein